jgi:hypothetical protein
MTRRVQVAAGMALAVAAAQALAERVEYIEIERPMGPPEPFECPVLRKAGPRRDWEQRQKPKNRKRRK